MYNDKIKKIEENMPGSRNSTVRLWRTKDKILLAEKQLNK
jgi:hypothetical protein